VKSELGIRNWELAGVDGGARWWLWLCALLDGFFEPQYKRSAG